MASFDGGATLWHDPRQPQCIYYIMRAPPVAANSQVSCTLNFRHVDDALRSILAMLVTCCLSHHS